MSLKSSAIDLFNALVSINDESIRSAKGYSGTYIEPGAKEKLVKLYEQIISSNPKFLRVYSPQAQLFSDKIVHSKYVSIETRLFSDFYEDLVRRFSEVNPKIGIYVNDKLSSLNIKPEPLHACYYYHTVITKSLINILDDFESMEHIISYSLEFLKKPEKFLTLIELLENEDVDESEIEDKIVKIGLEAGGKLSPIQILLKYINLRPTSINRDYFIVDTNEKLPNDLISAAMNQADKCKTCGKDGLIVRKD